MSGAGKSTLAELLALRLRELGISVEVLDGDVIRGQLCRDLGFDKADRCENIRRLGFISDLLSRNGIWVIVAAIAPYRTARNEVRMLVGDFVEVHAYCPLGTLIARDTKGLYARALEDKIPQFTGVSDSYEPPISPEVFIDSSIESPSESLNRIWLYLQTRMCLPTIK